LRVALDKASTVAIQLLGNNAHNGAFNSAALARATTSSGKVVGLSKATLAGDFAAFTKFVGVDADGNPNGTVNEDARWLLRAPDKLLGRFGDLMKARAQLPYLLNAAGITGFMDALVKPQFLELYDALERDGKLTARATLAQFYDPEEMKTADGPDGSFGSRGPGSFAEPSHRRENRRGYRRQRRQVGRNGYPVQRLYAYRLSVSARHPR